MITTLQQACQVALYVQSACNLSGVAHSFAEAMHVLRDLPECTGTKFANEHPVALLFATQIASLAGVKHDGAEWAAYAEAVDYCEKVIASHNATAPLADESKGTQS
mgnify:CR=1 FL=1